MNTIQSDMVPTKEPGHVELGGVKFEAWWKLDPNHTFLGPQMAGTLDVKANLENVHADIRLGGDGFDWQTLKLWRAGELFFEGWAMVSSTTSIDGRNFMLGLWVTPEKP